MPYIEALSKRDDVEHVWVVAPRLAYTERAAMGWPETWTNSSEKLTIKINPSDQEVDELFRSTSLHCGGGVGGSFCFFSGITAFPEVYGWFKISLGYKNLKRGIITEAPYTYDKPLWMHKIKFVLKDYRYIKYIDYVFAIGEDCAKYYRGWSKRWKVVPFMYCTEVPNLKCQVSGGMNLCFVGSLDKRKNVSVLMEALSMLKEMPLNVTIVGDGPERRTLEESAKTLGKSIVVKFMGALPMEETQKIIAQNDVLVLPSLHDGWGAVVNEAMMLGTLAICSNKCGAKYLIEKSDMGGVFDVDSARMLADNIEAIADNLKEHRAERETRIKWAVENISPKAVSEYFYESIAVYTKSCR